MIAVCPTCHDAIHNGPLVIDDDTLYRWKAVDRDGAAARRDHIYVEPATNSFLLLGSLAITRQEGVIVFDFSQRSRLSFELVDDDVMLIDLAVRDASGREVLRAVKGHVRHDAVPPLSYERVPGHVRVTAPATTTFLPEWVAASLRFIEPNFVRDGRIALLDIQVLEPGYVRVQGLWPDNDTAVVITERLLTFLRRDGSGPISLAGGGKDTVLHYAGPITTALFTFGAAGAIAVPRPLASAPGRNDPCWCGSGVKYKKCPGR
jgi:SEC-C motif